MKWIHLGLLLATSGLCLLTSFCLAGMFGGPTDTFNHLWPVWMAYAIGLLVATLSIRALPLSAATSICITLLAAMAIDTRELPVAEAERDVRILSQNLWGSVTAAEGVVSLVRTTAPDIIALQEVYNHQNPALDVLASDYPYFIRCRWESTRIYSRLPLSGTGCLRPDHRPGQPHLDLPSSTWAEIELPGGARFVLGSIHLTWPDPLSHQGEQIDAIAQELRRVERADLVLVGDFNAAAPARSLKRMEEDWQVARLTRHQASWPSPLPLFGIDHAFAGENWARVGIEVGPANGSDHRPLIVDLVRAGTD